MSISVRNIDESDAGDWDGYAVGHIESSFYHSYEWRGFFEEFFGKQTYYCAAFEHGQIVGVLPLVRQKSILFGDYMVSLPFLNYGGVLADSAAIGTAVVDHARSLGNELGTSHIELRGLSPVVELPVKSNKMSMRLALPATSDELSKALGSKLRSQIKRPQREGPELYVGGVELIDRFYSVFSRNMRDLGTPVYSKKMFTDLLRRFPKEAEIVLLELSGQTAAAGFLFHHRQMTEVPWASSDRRYNRISINMLLYWEMLRRSIEMGSTVFDFGRSSVDAGTFQFKKQWGAQPLQLYWSYVLEKGKKLPELNPENKKFSMAISLWQKFPLAVANHIGPLLARNLP